MLTAHILALTEHLSSPPELLERCSACRRHTSIVLEAIGVKFYAEQGAR